MVLREGLPLRSLPTLTVVYTMLLLAVQYCVQPPMMMRKFLDNRANNKRGISMVEEIVEFGLLASFFLGLSDCAVLQMVGRKILQRCRGHQVLS